MTNNQQPATDLILELCKPYLFDLVSLLAESLKYDDEPLHELLDGKSYPFSQATIDRIAKMSYRERTQALSEISYWIDSATQRLWSDRPTQ